METNVDVQPSVAKKGRPRKDVIASKRKGGRGVVGRPPGEAARLQEFRARLLGTTGEKIIETLIRKAMNDEDKDQFAALKFCAERILPLSAFDVKAGEKPPQVVVNISGLTDVNVSSGEKDVIDV
jgi:hypothetical protein